MAIMADDWLQFPHLVPLIEIGGNHQTQWNKIKKYAFHIHTFWNMWEFMVLLK